MRNIIRAALAAAALAAVPGGCDDDPPPPPPRQDLVVRVEEAETGAAVAGVKIVVMDGRANVPLAPALVSDAEGLCDFRRLLTGSESVLAFGGVDWRVYGKPGIPDWGKDDGVADPTTPPMPPYVAPPLVRVRPAGVPLGATVTGRVVDADTGEPLATAFVSDSSYPMAYVGGTDAGDDVTLADGAFSVAGILFLEDVDGVRQLVPLTVSRHGYRPRAWRYEPVGGEVPDPIEDVVIPLARVGDEPVGGLRGRVVRAGRPVPWVTVGLGLAGEAPATPDKAAVGAAGLSARTDADGVFVFTGLAPGRYVVHPGYLPRDGAWYPDPETYERREVFADSTVDAGDYPVLWEIEPWLPWDGAVVDRGHREFSWSPVPGAGLYWLTLDRGEPVALAGTSWTLAPGDTLAPGPHVWTVTAVGAADEPIGTLGGQAEFWVRE